VNGSPLYRFVGETGEFRCDDAAQLGQVYFPLANELGLLSAITPDLNGDIKTDQHTFFNHPVAFEDLHLTRAARNFWLVFPQFRPWSVSGRSVWQRAAGQRDGDDDNVTLEAGFLWQKLTRSNPLNGVQATVTSFVPSAGGTFEIMHVELKNIAPKTIEFTPVAAIPLYGRSADNLRDHRHVTSLLHRVSREPFGVKLRPTMTFNERGHLVNTTEYFVIGADEQGRAPTGIFPTVESFTGMGGDLERPDALLERHPGHSATTADDDGKEALGGLAFPRRSLKSGESVTYTLILGIDQGPSDEAAHAKLISTYSGAKNVAAALEETKKFWDAKLSRIRFKSGNADFDNWVRWVQLQPALRRIYGCSFLPDFDYGRGGRGWRDLWQDCLALILADPADIRQDMLNNWAGVRADGSNATIIGRKKIPTAGHPGFKWVPEFIADRNNIARTWMDHGVWPMMTSLLYVDQTGDWNFLLENTPYFRDGLRNRGKVADRAWTHSGQDDACQLKTRAGTLYQGTVLEHMLVQNLVQFFNVGEHNIFRLEDADWNDGLDMAHKRGESVAFTAMYAGNLTQLADALELAAAKAGWTTVALAEELALLIDRTRERVDYDSVADKNKRLEDYFKAVYDGLTGAQMTVSVTALVTDLREKAAWIKKHLNAQEWVTESGNAWYNGYYDNAGKRVEGRDGDRIKMTLSGQVYPVMAGLTDDTQTRSVVEAVNRHLRDSGLAGGVRLNTNFGAIQPNLGRAFSFSFGEKENGAVFSHMAVMWANALYRRRLSSEGHRVLSSLHELAKNSQRSRIFPGLPEYFNNQGRGRYAYLTGSASWYVLTLLTQVYGVRGWGGDLLIAPQLTADQFDDKGRASVELHFAGVRLAVTFINEARLAPGTYEIGKIRSPKSEVPFTRRGRGEVLVQRELIAQLKGGAIEVELAQA